MQVSNRPGRVQQVLGAFMRISYLVLALVGAVVPSVFILPWIANHGLDLAALVQELFSTRPGAFFGADVIISALALFVFMLIDSTTRRVRHAWLAVAATLGIGVSCGLPLYLYLRGARDRRLGDLK